MSVEKLKGRVHSFQSLGTVDGPGVRFVVFLQGCNLRCKCCHNPDTWDFSGGQEITAEEIVKKVIRYKEYYKNGGGITVSGGEPLLQSEFVAEIFSLCKKEGINTCLDTSGSVEVKNPDRLLSVTDRVLLDIKYTNNTQYLENAGCTMDAPLKFLDLLNVKGIPTTLRQVIIPTVNDSENNIVILKNIAASHSCVDKIELLPFRKICQTKYDSMGIEFPFENISEPTPDIMENLNKLLT